MSTKFGPDPEMPIIGHSKQLFLDNFILESVRNITRVMHQPEKYEGNPVLKKDKPWEIVPDFEHPSFNVYYDENDGLFKCWYLDFPSQLSPNNVPVLYAQSKDGVNWDKPSFRFREYNGQGTNILFGGWDFGNVFDFSILKDDYEKDPKKRYKMVFMHTKPGANLPKKSPYRNPNVVGLALAFSGDGISWEFYPWNPVSTLYGDDTFTLTYNEEERKYFLVTRHPYGPHGSSNPSSDNWFTTFYVDEERVLTKRHVWQNESSDCINWEGPYLLLKPDEEDNLDDALYGMVRFKVGNLWIGMLQVLHQVPNTMEVQLVYSRDGRNWKRAFNRRTFIPNGPPESWDEFYVTTTNPPIHVGEELWFFYGGANNHHDWWIVGKQQGLDIPEATDPSKVNYGLGLAKLRVDAFVSLDATVREGVITTKPFFSDGRHLIINAECEPKGYVDVEILDHFDNVWKDFNRGACDTFTGDSVNHTVSWNGRKDVNMIPGHIKLKFYLKYAKLYSFRVSDK